MNRHKSALIDLAGKMRDFAAILKKLPSSIYKGKKGDNQITVS